MEEYWARLIDPSGKPGLNYWELFAERLVQLSNIHQSSTILDLGTYDGNVLLRALKDLNPPSFGVGVDVYCGGFKDGIKASEQHGLENDAAFVQSDGNALGFLPGIFDTVLANFIGWDDCFDFERMEFIGPNLMMSEIYRVLKPGGKVGIGSWVVQTDIDWIIDAFKGYLPEYENNMTCYGKENPKGYEKILNNGGFGNIQIIEERTNFISPDVETWWRQMRQAARSYFEQITDSSTLEKFKEQVSLDLQRFVFPEGIRFSKMISYAFGTKPI